MTTDDKLNLLLSEVSSVKTELASVKTEFGARLSGLEAIAEDRARDTRPMLDKLRQEIAETRIELKDFRKEVKEQFERMDFKLEYFNKEVLEMRPDHGLLKQRVTKLERQAA